MKLQCAGPHGRRRCRSAFAVAALALLASAPGFAAEPRAAADATGEATETMVITGTHQPLPASQVPGSFSVIGGDTIEASQLDGALDVLRHVPGLHVDQPGTRGSRASLYVRGLDPSLTQVLVDGIVVNDTTNARGGSFDFATLGTGDIDRIEVARGARSSVYGSDAIAGALQVVTRDGRGEDRATLEARGGSFGTWLARGAVGGQRGPFDLALSASTADAGDPQNIGTWAGSTLHAKLGAALGETTRFEGVVRTTESRSKAFPEFSGGTQLAARRQFEERDVHDLATGLSLVAEPHEALSAELRIGSYLRREDRTSPGVAARPGEPFSGLPGEPDSVDRLQRYDALARVTLHAPHGLDLSVGGNYRFEEGQSRGSLDFGGGFVQSSRFSFDRSVGGPFAELLWTGPWGLQVLAGVRFDASSDEEHEWSPRAALSLSLAELLAEAGIAPLPVDVEIHGSYGEGFKLPSFFSLANPVAGNPLLDPETSQGGDFGLRVATPDRRVEASVTGFVIEVNDLIDFDLASFQLQNLDRVRSRGVEIGLQLVPCDTLEVSAHTTFVQTRDRSGRRLRNRPEWRAGTTLTWSPLDGVRARLAYLFVGDVDDASVPTGDSAVNLGQWHRVDLALEWAAAEHVVVTLAVDNLLDADYEEAVGFPSVSTRARAGVRLSY